MNMMAFDVMMMMMIASLAYPLGRAVIGLIRANREARVMSEACQRALSVAHRSPEGLSAWLASGRPV